MSRKKHEEQSFESRDEKLERLRARQSELLTELAAVQEEIKETEDAGND